MAFTVHHVDGVESFDDHDRYEFDSTHRHLVTIRADGRRRIYSPAAWTFVEDGPDKSEQA